LSEGLGAAEVCEGEIEMKRLVEAKALSALLAGLLGWADGVGGFFVLDTVKTEALAPDLLVVV
jgi:hypothetical protein